MTINRREFCIAAAGVVAVGVAPAFAEGTKLKSGSVYKVAVSAETSKQIIMIGELKVTVGSQVRAARQMGLKINDGDVIQLTDTPRAFGLNAGQASDLAQGPVVLGVSHYWCDDTPDGAAYGCWSD